MNKKWRASTHAISDIRDWNRQSILILQPDYQRKEVWGDAAKMMLIDSILNGIPMPKIFVSSTIKDGKTVRTVIDGQQRITTILAFLADGFPLAAPYSGEFVGKRFSELHQNVQEEVLSYDIDFNEAKGLSDDELREVYSRINKYFVALNKQELRRADYPGDFLDVADDLANLEFFDDCGIFTATARRRSLDVEYVSELLAGLLMGITDRKDAIDVCCKEYRHWEHEAKRAVFVEFTNVLSDIEKLFSSGVQIKKTRWKQKADFYSLFFAIRSLRGEGLVLPDDLTQLRGDLSILNQGIAPTSDVPIFSKYAVYCVSQANSASSRNWRTYFLTAILRGTYAGTIANLDQRQIVMEIASDIRFAVDSNADGDGCPPVNEFVCPACGVRESSADLAASVLFWEQGTRAFQISNAKWAHASCLEKLGAVEMIKGADFVDLDGEGSLEE
ncbi:DUF262 domain-containing protein [Rhodoferax saidenbachensis]|uniref:GmrSD restriction endonucleases N-terminal domain-containing protein n=1 Tax=Rhodoferax saidenbachensis TaxID=1484693 RepID=A0ABU1ZRR4_9BURK|nr:DUF262 domain-containing protein [Rhodoferax saidenbachensis]MDR7308220.1 hypothetical protein [Rhodoferax saidenbachensis]